MQCPRCLNTDQDYFYRGSRGWYCRRCIPFGRAMLEEEKEPVGLAAIQKGSGEYTLRYPLTEAQKTVSRQCARLIRDTDVLLHCVCGSGKTELVIESIAMMLKEGKKVCFAIPRRQVVLELQERLAGYFPNAKVIAVCGGHTDETDGDLIVATTHQLYRYYRTFDLLVLDEPDAFPFRGNPVLHGIAETCRKGHMICLTATPDSQLLKKVREKKMVSLTLNRRPHGQPLPVPVIRIVPGLFMVLPLLRWLQKHRSLPCMVFVPSVRLAECLGVFLSLFFDCIVCTGRTENRDALIAAFREQKAGVMVCTTVMERGMTVENVQVCVYKADSRIFDEAGLVQMAGRAGRVFAHPDGDVLFLCRRRSETAERCAAVLQEANACAV